MSGHQQPQQAIMGAVQPPATGVVDHNVPQPRQPSNLQGLLRFAMDATKAEDAPGNSSFMPLDEERKNFLDDALKSMTVDVIELLHKNVQILRNSDTLSVDADVTEYMNAFETILEHVDRIDTAIDFYKIGGFMVFAPCFNSVHASIRAGACDLLAELCQNNPYCQQIVAGDTEIMAQLLGLVDKDSDENVQVKALYALSCNVREYPEGLAVFMKNDGLAIVHRALQRPIDKLRTKAAFLLSCLLSAEQDVQLRTKLVAMDTVPLLISLISQERLPSHEHLLKLLILLVVNGTTAAAHQCTDPRYNFRAVLRQHLQVVQAKPEYREEEQCCTILLNTVFKTDHTDMDR